MLYSDHGTRGFLTPVKQVENKRPRCDAITPPHSLYDAIHGRRCAHVDVGPPGHIGRVVIDDQGEQDYEAVRGSVLKRGMHLKPEDPLFVVDAGDVFKSYLRALPKEWRQHYRCTICSNFFKVYGSVVTVNHDGTLRSAVWPGEAELPAGPYGLAIFKAKGLVEGAQIVRSFLPLDNTWGLLGNRDQRTGRDWSHIWTSVHADLVFKPTLLQTHAQREAVIAQDQGLLSDAMRNHSYEALMSARTLLARQSLQRREKFVPWLDWLIQVKYALNNLPGVMPKTSINHLLWQFAAVAPAGWCHVNSSVVGQLLRWVEERRTLNYIADKWNELVSPTNYQRPTAQPADGNIDRAESIVQKLGILPSLRRRFARAEEVPAIWVPTPSRSAGALGAFVHLRHWPQALPLEATPMTFAKFRRDVMPLAREIRFVVPHHNTSFGAICTASVEGSPPIHRWDMTEKRNQLSWYVQAGGSPAARFNLRAGQHVAVTRICLGPQTWGCNDWGGMAYFLLDCCRDVRNAEGLAIFPETLRPELREVRGVIEAHSRSGKLEGAEQATACGIFFGDAIDNGPLEFLVQMNSVVARYKIDRWS